MWKPCIEPRCHQDATGYDEQHPDRCSYHAKVQLGLLEGYQPPKIGVSVTRESAHGAEPASPWRGASRKQTG